VVVAAEGYPGTPQKGSSIRGVDEAAGEGAEIFHAGTAEKAGALVASGGRVHNVTAMGPTGGAAPETAYRAVDRIDWPQGFCRRDIGWRAVEREKAGVSADRA